MAKQKSTVLNLVAWFTGVVVSLAVGFGLVSGTLTLPDWLGGMSNAGLWVTWVVGWIVVITTLLGVVLGLLRK